MTIKFKHILLSFLILSTFTLTSCVRKPVSVLEHAIAVVYPTQGNNVKGIVKFYQVDKEVKVVAEISGLKPNQEHGFHIHEYGDISAKNGTSAGGHYNPEDKKHGLPPNPERHAGAFGNLQADAKGNASFEFMDDTITIAGRKNPIVGRSVIIHAKKDIGVQPTGGAGARIGMGVIGIGK